MIIPFSLTFKSCPPQIYVRLISFKVIQILNSTVSGEILQVAFSFQNPVKVSYVRHFFKFKCVLQMSIKTFISFNQRGKEWICACSVVSGILIDASNKPLCGTLIINLGKNSICASYCNQIKTSFARIR